MTIKGAMIAASVAGMFAAGASGIASAKEGAAKGGDDVACNGVNSCKGKGSCHGANNACAGQNGCKGQGWTKMSKDECLKKGGKVAPEKK
jgi:uncharacterized membrane protein